MRKAKRTILLLIQLCAITGYAQHSSETKDFDIMLNGLLRHTVPEVVPSPDFDAKAVLFLDAREKEEFEVSHLPDAKWVGYTNFKLKMIENIPKSEPIIVYCTVGYRSEKVAEKLKKKGFTNVSNLYGGIFKWIDTGNPVVIENSPAKSVHTFNREWAKWLKDSTYLKIHD